MDHEKPVSHMRANRIIIIRSLSTPFSLLSELFAGKCKNIGIIVTAKSKGAVTLIANDGHFVNSSAKTKHMTIWCQFVENGRN